ncbi:hypothetical protein EVAR_385_1 [Eumeta japonica]|uniref:Uncharacterized protein n=1 Tax=Eumeta variegata TaxID=151549 RepID=A0A4C1SA57_EUMVA|nr:hypothetical protein EVAR_385_1 [Eumeta japonica]
MFSDAAAAPVAPARIADGNIEQASKLLQARSYFVWIMQIILTQGDFTMLNYDIFPSGSLDRTGSTTPNKADEQCSARRCAAVGTRLRATRGGKRGGPRCLMYSDEFGKSMGPQLSRERHTQYLYAEGFTR